MKTLLIDNYDSFTYNLFQLLGEVNGEQPIVVRNDAATWAELAALELDNVVLSPGPGRPDRDGDFGVCADAIASAAVPLLGVCLGHQGIARAFGGAVEHAPEVVHGRADTVIHDGHPLFAGIPRELAAVRYHSLAVADPLPPELQSIARTRDGTIMALAHRTRPLWGVQFHPESIATDHGARLIANFRDLTPRRQSGSTHAAVGGTPVARPAARPASAPTLSAAHPASAPAPSAVSANEARRPPVRAPAGLELQIERIARPCDPEAAFVDLYGDSPTAFWLDSSSHPDGRSRFSFIGDASGPHSAVVTYDVAAREVAVDRGGETETHHETIFDYLARELDRLRIESPELPFDFAGGFVGYLGYELKADCGGDLAHESPLPDAALILADRLIAFDHEQRCTYLVALGDTARRWLRSTGARLSEIGDLNLEAPPVEDAVDLRLSRPRERYLEDIERCKEKLVEGESYEICLTNRLSAALDAEPLELYRALRRVNPAPYSAFLRFGETAVLSSSPERFLRVDRDGWAEAKPIKGTAARGGTPAEDARRAAALRASAKDRAENLMVTDLLRNDLGSVCEIGSVHVPALMEVETYETVHQLVTTVRGRLRADLGIPGCIRACFPAGSMTGAPKRRTMEIVDELEGEARGVYSGAVGYLGLGGGCDLGVVIRTIVLDGDTATVGAGGAIVAASDPQAEYREMLLKAAAPMRAIDRLADLQAALPDDGLVAAGMRPD